MKFPIRVLQLNYGSSGAIGGVSTLTLRWYQFIDKSKIKFTFLSRGGTFEIFRNEIEGYGDKIVTLGATGCGIPAHIRYIYKLYKHIKDNPYDIVHISSGSQGFNFVSLLVCKMAGVKIRIVHSRNTRANPKKTVFRKIFLKQLTERLATHFFSISKKASIFMFSKRLISSGKVQIIKNGINTEEFVYNEVKREQVRLDLELGEDFVIGHIGRFVEQKNHIFLLEIFREVLSLHPCSTLLLIGEGGLETAIKEQAKRLGILEKIKFLGIRKDVPALLSAMDVFVFPSLFEGFGNVGLEAQAAGLPTIMSDVIPDEISVTDEAIFLSLDQSAKEWAKTILAYTDYKRRDQRQRIIEAGYEMKEVAKQLENDYLSFYNKIYQ